MIIITIPLSKQCIDNVHAKCINVHAHCDLGHKCHKSQLVMMKLFKGNCAAAVSDHLEFAVVRPFVWQWINFLRKRG